MHLKNTGLLTKAKGLKKKKKRRGGFIAGRVVKNTLRSKAKQDARLVLRGDVLPWLPEAYLRKTNEHKQRLRYFYPLA